VVEIKTTASLQHPHILPLFDSGTADGFLYYVMPYIQGETIREKLNRETQFGVDEAVRITREVADALDYAHRHGVIHRDIKPENILLHDGRAIVMDFGIALAVSAAAGGRMTETGLSLGTPHYMSPEQATADKDLTLRSDIYSLASVLYEMVAGEPPHTGGSAQAVIMKIIVDTPRPLHELRRNVPPNVSAAVMRAIEKVPADRFETARAFSEALANPAFTTVGAATAISTARGSRRMSPPLLYGMAAISVLSLATAAWVWRKPAPPPEMPSMRFTLELPDSLRILPALGGRGLAISPDGSEIVYIGAIRNVGPLLYRRRLDDFRVSAIPGSTSPQMPVYAPDGTLALDQQGRALVRLSPNGGPAVRIVDDAGNSSWGDGDVIVFRRGSSLWRTTASGATPVRLTSADSTTGAGHAWPQVLPGGKAVLFNLYQEGQNESEQEVAVVRLADGVVKTLGIVGLGPRYATSGHIVVARRNGSLTATPFDLGTLEVRGPTVTVLEGVLVKPTGAALFDISRNGVLTYVDGDAFVQPVIVDRTGKETKLNVPPGLYSHPRWSPTGDRVVIERSEGNLTDIWILTPATGQSFRLTRDGRSGSPEWSSDGNRVGWIRVDSGRAAIRWQRADGSGSPVVIPTPGLAPFKFLFAPGDKHLVVVAGSAFTHDIVLVPLDSTVAPRPLANAQTDELQPTISPDGRWLAFMTNETGRGEVYVSSVDDPTTRVQITTEGGVEPVWGSDGRSLIVRSGSSIVSLTMSLEPRIEVKQHTAMFPERFRRGAPDRIVDVNPRDGSYVALTRDMTRLERIVVVSGWLKELRERAPVASSRR
jgi:serine/threonine-protein kinase